LKKKKKIINVLTNLPPLRFKCIGGEPKLKGFPHYMIDSLQTNFTIKEFTIEEIEQAIEDEIEEKRIEKKN